MDAKKHQDYRYEKQRLAETKALIHAVIETAESDRKDFQGNIKHALEELDHLDSSLSWVNILANANLLEMTKKHLEHLKNVRYEPYFARMDFTPDETKQREILYLGKTSLFQEDNQEPVIVDWRSPIANLYYEGRLGDVSYEGNQGSFSGELSLKRQYLLEKGELDEIRDIDMTARDQMLQESLTTNADSRLKDIVSTIQAEQNRIIRAQMNKPLIVQGVAGSGKTTIALHRIAYVIYTYSESFHADNMMILAPNNLFLDYISAVLPELGVDAVRQKTFTEYVQEAVGKKLKFARKDELLTILIDESNEQLVEKTRWIATFKGSIAFKQMLDGFISAKETQLVPSEDLNLERYTVFSTKKIHQLFFEEYTYLPPARRVEKIKMVIKKQGKKKIEEILEKVEKVYDDKIEKLRYGIKDQDIRREKVVAIVDKKDAHMEKLKKESKSLIATYIKKFPKINLIKEYREFMTNKEQLVQFAQIEPQQAAWLVEDAESSEKRKQFSMEDAGALLYFVHKFNGIPSQLKMNNVIVDEAQDYSIFEFEVMKQAMETEVFTILGDLSQGIQSYRGISDWETVIDEVFPNAQFQQLTQSYRTTVEIMNKANQVLDFLPEKQAYKATPVIRHDEAPKFKAFSSNEELITEIEKNIQALAGKQYQSFAIIGKNEAECKKIEEILLRKTNLSVQRLNDTDEVYDTDLVIVPSFLAKGLEFDVVFIALLEEEYTLSEIDVKLLYVAMTRALHRLFLFSEKNHGKLFQKVLS